MIYLEGLRSIIESIYLNDSLNNRSNTCDVYVNPGATKYLTGKIVIVNSLEYPREKIENLVDNGCKVISRLYSDIPGVEVRPYILKISCDVLWNGRVLDEISDIDELLGTGSCDFDVDTYKLYFPKIKKPGDKVIDEYGNLSGLGWTLQQVGVNIKTNTPFINLDLLKTGKIDY